MTHTHSQKLTATLSRLHAAIVQNPSTSTATTRRAAPPVVTVTLSRQHEPRPTVTRCAPLETVTDPAALPPGPRRLLELLHAVTVSTVGARGYPVTPSQATVHQPQELLARALGCSLKSVYNWTQALKALGLIDARAHYTTSRDTTRADGTLYAVALKPGHRAHLPHDDLAHQWRDLDADRAAGRTAWKLFTGSDPREEKQWITTLKAWAVAPGSVTDSRYSSDPVNGPATVQDVSYMLPILAEAHPDKRPALVGLMASTLAHALHDSHSRRWYCRLIWNAWTAEMEGRGGLQQLAAQLARLDADRREWTGLRSPGALLASRLRAG